MSISRAAKASVLMETRLRRSNRQTEQTVSIVADRTTLVGKPTNIT